jgi:hypothetical protein
MQSRAEQDSRYQHSQEMIMGNASKAKFRFDLQVESQCNGGNIGVDGPHSSLLDVQTLEDL